MVKFDSTSLLERDIDIFVFVQSFCFLCLSIHPFIHPPIIHPWAKQWSAPCQKKKKNQSVLIPLSPSLYLACGTRDEESQKKKRTGISQQKKPLNTLCLHEILQNRMQSPFNTNVLNFPKCSGCHINNNSTQLKQAMYWILGKCLHFKQLLLLLLLSRFSRVRLCAAPEMAAHQAPPSLGFSRQEHWSGLPFPSPMHEKWKVKVKSLSRVRLFATPRTAAYQVPPPGRLQCDFPGKSIIGVGCHFLLRIEIIVSHKSGD